MNLKKVASNVSKMVVTPNITLIFSYDTPVAAEVNGVPIVTSRFYSETTTRHINRWLNGRKAEQTAPAFFWGLAGL